MDLSLNPEGQLILRDFKTLDLNLKLSSDSNRRLKSKPILDISEKDLLSSLKLLLIEGDTQLILGLLSKPGIHKRAPAFKFWLEFGSDFLHKFCESADGENLSQISDEYFKQKVLGLAPMAGGEYLSSDLLRKKWTGLEEFVEAERSKLRFTSREYIDEFFPAWNQVGKIHFHLAENTANPSYPFAFLATYSLRVPGKARTQHLPLGNAVKAKGNARDLEGLKNILIPITEAQKFCNFLGDMVETKKIYQANEITATQAHRFLCSSEIYKRAGIIVKVPKLWSSNRPPQAKMTVTVGAKEGKSRVGFDSLMKFNSAVTIDGIPLTAEQLNKLLESDQPLVSFEGKWVEVDRNKIEGLLSRWEKAQAISGESLSFADAMRLLSGAKPSPDAETPDVEESDKKWLEFIAEIEVKELLAKLRNPEAFKPDSDEARILGDKLNAKLREYQTNGVNWLVFLRSLGLGGCLADDMGLGKTIQVLSFFLLYKYHMRPDDSGCPNLVIAPASLIANWYQEAKKFAPSLKILIAHPSGPIDSKLLRSGNFDLDSYDVIISTYSMATRLEWISTRKWKNLIIDEAQAIKNSKTKTTIAIKRIEAECKYALTGTPVENRLQDLWSIFDFCCPSLLGSSQEFERFAKKLGESESKNAYLPLRKLVEPYLLRRKKTDKSIISDLPDKIEMKAYCTLSKAQIDLYQKNVKELIATIKALDKDDPKRRGVILSYLQKFKQICNHPSHFLGDQKYDHGDSGKFDRLKEIAKMVFERGEKILVFTQFREMTDILEGLISEISGRSGLILHGGTAISKRQILVNEFQKPTGPNHFILSLKAAGTGLNLTGANHVVHFDRWWNPAVEDQATDRAYRIGQKKNVMVHKFVVRGTIEERIDEMIDDKRAMAGQILGDKSEFKMTELSDDDLIKLVSLDLSRIET